MKLYEEILLLDNYDCKAKWVIENVISFYEPLIKPMKLGRHYFWSNFPIEDLKTKPSKIRGTIEELQERKGFDLSNENLTISMKTKLLRNTVEPELGQHIYNQAFKKVD